MLRHHYATLESCTALWVKVYTRKITPVLKINTGMMVQSIQTAGSRLRSLLQTMENMRFLLDLLQFASISSFMGLFHSKVEGVLLVSCVAGVPVRLIKNVIGLLDKHSRPKENTNLFQNTAQKLLCN